MKQLSIRYLFSILFLLTFLISDSFAQKIVWQKLIGGLGYDNGLFLFREDDGSFIIAGTTQSTDGIGEGNHGAGIEDVVIFKMAPSGVILWRTLIGGSGEEMLEKVKRTDDDGFILTGTTLSNDGDFEDNHGKYDIFLAKINESGYKEWVKCYGGTGNDKGSTVTQSYDGGYLIGGEAGSRNGDIDLPKGGLDAWFVKTDRLGKILWKKNFGGSDNERVMEILEVPGRKTLIVSSSKSRDGHVKHAIGKKDVWAVMLSKNNDIIWQKNFGGTDFDDISGVVVNQKDNLVFCGTTFSADGDIRQQRGLGDIWVFEIDTDGNWIWGNTYGGSKPDGANNIIKTLDGGYLICGTSTSKDGDSGPNQGHYDGLILRIDSVGNLQWSMSAGGEDYEAFEDAYALNEEEFMVLGWAESVDGNLGGTGKDFGNDMWLARVSPYEEVSPLEFSPYIMGRTMEQSTRKPVKTEITITDNASLKQVNQVFSDEKSGKYKVLFKDLRKKLSINFLAEGYMFYGQDIPVEQLKQNPHFYLYVNLQPIKVGSKVVLDHIYFNSGEYEIKDESKPELHRLLYFLKKNPNLSIEISGHTDNTGNTEHKKELSLRRAEKVRDWLLINGFPGRQMDVVGYGMEQPLASNETEQGRTFNRRVEIKITYIR